MQFLLLQLHVLENIETLNYDVTLVWNIACVRLFCPWKTTTGPWSTKDLLSSMGDKNEII